ncbi:14 kDa phosphohistidine phosphatase isoform X1 [Arapaima gigas]
MKTRKWISESKMAAAVRLAEVPAVDIDADGVFKYVLIRVSSTEEGDDSSVDIVRGYAWAEYHADIYDRVAAELEKGGNLDCECLGGGRIKHDSKAKKIHVYGYSVGFGRANHSVSTEKLKTRYPDYEGAMRQNKILHSPAAKKYNLHVTLGLFKMLDSKV